jgi:hypothetical protein
MLQQMLETSSMGMKTCISKKALARSNTPHVVRNSFSATCVRSQSLSLASKKLGFREKMWFAPKILTPESNFEICEID